MIKRLTLVSMPYIVPTSPPLGIASLKSYIEKNSTTKVKCIDVNLLFTKDFIELIEEDSKKKVLGGREKLLLEASKFLKNKEAYSDIEKLKNYSGAFSLGFQIVNKASINFSKEYIEGKRNDIILMEKYVSLILENNPDMVGFSISYLDQIINSIAMAKRLKRENPNIKIVFGGSLLRKDMDAILKKTKKFVDYIIYNQGEEALSSLVKVEEKNKIPNLMYIQDDDVKVNEERLATNLNNLPFADFSDLKLEDYYIPSVVLPVISAKGCYWRKCSFCTHYQSYSYKYMPKSIKLFIEELKHYNKEYNTRYFYFADEMISPVRFEKIADEIINSGLKINYLALVKPSDEFTPEILDKMFKSGCRALLSGIESGNQRILDLINKGTNVKDNENFLRRANKASIRNVCYFFVGFPTETKRELEETRNFIIRNKDLIDVILYGRFHLDDGSYIMKNPEKFNIRIKGIKRVGNTMINDFEVLTKDGIQPDSSIYKEYVDFLKNFKESQYELGKYRDHMLVYFSQKI